MNNNKMYLDNYNSVSEDVKYLTKSIVRLKILSLLYDKPRKMKEIFDVLDVSYSSVSGNMHDLELKGFIYRKSNKYFLHNATKIIIRNIIEMDQLLTVTDKFFNIFDHHIVNVIPDQSVMELYMLKKASLIETDDLNAYKTYEYIEDALGSADYVRCILPFYHERFNGILNDLISIGRPIEAFVCEDEFEIFDEMSDISALASYRRKNNFMLISTDKVMILGLFKNDGKFDQNRLLISRNADSIRWADNLFCNFKMEYG